MLPAVAEMVPTAGSVTAPIRTFVLPMPVSDDRLLPAPPNVIVPPAVFCPSSVVVPAIVPVPVIDNVSVLRLTSVPPWIEPPEATVILLVALVSAR